MSLRWLGQPVYHHLFNLPISYLPAPSGPLRGSDQQDTFSCPVKGLLVPYSLKDIITSQPAGWLFQNSYFLSLQEAINKRQEETLTTASQDLLIKGEEEIDREVIPSEGEDNSPTCQSFAEALSSWSCVLKDSDELLPLIKE